MMNALVSQGLFCLLICAAKVVEISIQSIKTVSMVKGQRTVASVLAFIECLIWPLYHASHWGLSGASSTVVEKYQ